MNLRIISNGTPFSPPVRVVEWECKPGLGEEVIFDDGYIYFVVMITHYFGHTENLIDGYQAGDIVVQVERFQNVPPGLRTG